LDWIDARQDTESVSDRRVKHDHASGRSADERWVIARSHPVRVARSGRNVTQMHYARQGIITPEMEFVAIRENQRQHTIKEKQHPVSVERDWRLRGRG